MRTGAGLALICVGAILAFAVTAHASFMSLACTSWSFGPPICAEYTSAPSIVMMKVFG